MGCESQKIWSSTANRVAIAPLTRRRRRLLHVGRRVRAQDADRVLTVIASERDELVEDSLLVK